MSNEQETAIVHEVKASGPNVALWAIAVAAVIVLVFFAMRRRAR
ncbi:MAG: hypothetical protein ACRDJH_15180 [Thermomicrobiales bacterium]